MLAKEEEITGEGAILLFTPKSGHIMDSWLGDLV